MDEATKDTRNAVLIVEDEPIVRMSISDALLQGGFEVLASSNGAEALELIAKRPHVFAVVSAIAMPGPIDGFDYRACPRVGPDGASEIALSWRGLVPIEAVQGLDVALPVTRYCGASSTLEPPQSLSPLDANAVRSALARRIVAAPNEGELDPAR